MPYTQDEFNNKIKEIGGLDDIAKVRAELVGLQDNISGIFDENKQLTAKAGKLETDIAEIRDINNKLFTQITEKKTPEDNTKTEPPETDLKYENLFDEKGELK